MQLLLHFSGVNGALGISVPLWGPLFYLTGNYVQEVLLVPDMLTSMRLITGTFGDPSCGVGRKLYLILLFWGEGVSTPILRRIE